MRSTASERGFDRRTEGQLAAQCVLTFRMRSHPRSVALIEGQKDSLQHSVSLTFRMRSHPRSVVLKGGQKDSLQHTDLIPQTIRDLQHSNTENVVLHGTQRQLAAQCVLTFRMRSHPRSVVLMGGQKDSLQHSVYWPLGWDHILAVWFWWRTEGQIAAQCVLTFRMRSHSRSVVLMGGQKDSLQHSVYWPLGWDHTLGVWFWWEDRRTACSTVCTDL